MYKILTLFVFPFYVMAQLNTSYITVGQDTMSSLQNNFSGLFMQLDSSEDRVLLEVDSDKIEGISHLIHEEFQRCAGFIHHDTIEDAYLSLNNQENELFGSFGIFDDYVIDQSEKVNKYVSEVLEVNITSTIKKLSSYQNRYYNSSTGVESSHWIKSNWEALSGSRSDIDVKLYEHRKWKQPSVIMTITGSERPEEVIVVGGHADSIAGYFGRSRSRAPGADDNASGISSITEAIRVLMENDYRPKRTIKFMAYAAEEVGLRGSGEIANSFKKKGVNVVGVLQLDMTNHKGDDRLDIVMMTDYTNKGQNEFLGKLIDTYVHVPWGYDKCGYGCSDHASWHKTGYPASMPFETTFRGINKKIHTKDDTLANTRGNADHAVHFSKLAISYIVELGK